jgi:hypothetical protein
MLLMRACGRVLPEPTGSPSPGQAFDLALHLLGGAAREGQQRDVMRVDSAAQDMCNRRARVLVLLEPAPATIKSRTAEPGVPIPCSTVRHCSTFKISKTRLMIRLRWKIRTENALKMLMAFRVAYGVIGNAGATKSQMLSSGSDS